MLCNAVSGSVGVEFNSIVVVLNLRDSNAVQRI